MNTKQGILMLASILLILLCLSLAQEYYDKPTPLDRVVDATQMEEELRFEVVCLDNVEYWYRRGLSGRSFLAVKMSPETLSPTQCTLSTSN